ncbi:hypothetical protein [Alkalicoccobacillus porphyridii]|uniref:Uncharacterized protein n=1 Tax=Alkalicoccobacillus porphyridii TaxID=2597270 RepID=A0A553ZWD5_9BACI|nr:hypothetical protein [Alkalicoccobacillus porphyridii]TSB45742.1 hypothetical protein FN960_14750 [Alkalicoccobacillus porphyridii]
MVAIYFLIALVTILLNAYSGISHLLVAPIALIISLIGLGFFLKQRTQHKQSSKKFRYYLCLVLLAFGVVQSLLVTGYWYTYS